MANTLWFLIISYLINFKGTYFIILKLINIIKCYSTFPGGGGGVKYISYNVMGRAILRVSTQEVTLGLVLELQMEFSVLRVIYDGIR